MHFDTDILFYIDSKQYPVGRICFFTESENACTVAVHQQELL
nr:MAG TPA: hypothetical protein [Caudoviricetes sp.]